MTTLGKIFAFGVLVLAVVASALMVMVYVTRTNWKTGYEAEASLRKVAQAEAASERAKFKAITDQADARVQAADARVVQITGERDRLQMDLDATRLQVDDARKNIEKSDVAKKDSAEAQKRLQAEVDNLQKILAARQLELVNAQADARTYQSQAVRTQIEVDSLKGRLENLTGELENLARDNERLKNRAANGVVTVSNGGNGGSITAVAKVPPPEFVRGQITAADPKDGLVTISLGSDAGLSVNNTLEVYRLKPEPLYLGTIKIIDVRHHDAVGRSLDPKKRSLIKVGDEVSSDILPR